MTDLYFVPGRGVEGTICTLAHHVIWSTPNYVYGGFLRDLVVGGLSHTTMDLDVGVRMCCLRTTPLPPRPLLLPPSHHTSLFLISIPLYTPVTV